MKKCWQYFCQLKKVLICLLFVSIVYIILYTFILSTLSPLFKGAAKTGKLFSELSISYISSLVFYFLVVHIKQEKDKEKLNSYISEKVKSICGCAKEILRYMSNTSGVKQTNEYGTEKELRGMCAAIDPRKEVPVVAAANPLQNLNWIQFLNAQKQISINMINQLFIRITYLDSEFVTLLSEIEDCSFYKTLSIMTMAHLTLPIGDVDLKGYQQDISGYLGLVKKLDTYGKQQFGN